MVINTTNAFLAATIFTCIWAEGEHRNYKKRNADNGADKCGYNQYFNEGVCTECRTGTFGKNCLIICKPPTYGKLCGKTCNCSQSTCHHVYGCSIPTICPAGYYGDNCSATCPQPTYGNGCMNNCSCSNTSCHHVFGCNFTTENAYQTPEIRDSAERDINLEDVKQSTKNISIAEYTGNVLVISIGILISLTLLMLIGRESLKLCGMSDIHSNYVPENAPNADIVSGDITESHFTLCEEVMTT